jgi:hypothetical protein
MQSYSKGSVEPFIPVHYNGNVAASIQGYNKGSVGPIIVVHYSCYVEAPYARL